MLVKPNKEELEAIFDCSPETASSIVTAGRKLIAAGARHAIISLGAAGAYYFCEDKVLQSFPPEGKLVDSVGAGDSVVAGFLYGMQCFDNNEAIFQFASACGSATAYADHLATNEEIRKLVPKIEIIER